MKDPWFADHSNIVTLTSWMAENGYDPDDIAYAVEKPWKFEEEFLDALQEQIHPQGEEESIE